MKSPKAPFIARKRRDVLITLAATAGLAVAGCKGRTGERIEARGKHEEAEVTPGEDLMQEHGVLERILLVYDEASRRIELREQLDPSIIKRAATMVRRFVEDYHEKLEEQFVFPRLQKARRETTLVAVLLRQHQRGRELTDEIVRRAGAAEAAELAQLLRAFGSMYRPHLAREDTVLFPAFRDVVGGDNYRELGEEFEDKEHALFGKQGFHDVVRQVADLERALELDDLARFTPA